MSCRKEMDKMNVFLFYCFCTYTTLIITYLSDNYPTVFKNDNNLINCLTIYPTVFDSGQSNL